MLARRLPDISRAEIHSSRIRYGNNTAAVSRGRRWLAREEHYGVRGRLSVAISSKLWKKNTHTQTHLRGFFLDVTNVLTVLFAGRRCTGPLAIRLARTTLQANDVVTVLAGVRRSRAEQTPAGRHAAESYLVRFGAFTIWNTSQTRNYFNIFVGEV